MPIPELDKFREKYPQYNDLDDVKLAEALYKKHPQYVDVLEKAYVAKEQAPALEQQKRDPLMQSAKGTYEGSKWLPYPEDIRRAAEQIPADPSLGGTLIRSASNVGVSMPLIMGAGATIGKVAPALGALTKVRPFTGSAVSTGGAMAGAEAIKATGETLGGQEEAGNIIPRVVGAGATGALFGVTGQVGSNLAVEGARKVLPEVSRNVAERVGSAVTQGATGALIAPEGEKVSEALLGGAMGAVMPQRYHDFKPSLKKEATSIYRDILRPTQGEVKKIEIRQGKDINDYYQLAAEEGLQIKKTADDKLDTEEARLVLEPKVEEIHTKLDAELASDKTKRFGLNKLRTRAKNEIRNQKKAVSAEDLASALNEVDVAIDAEIALHGDKVDGVTLNRIKQGMWNKSYDQLAPNKKDTARKIGHIAKEMIERGYSSANIKEINELSGKYQTLRTLLENAQGRVIKGGRLGGYFARATGAIAGHATGMPIIGELGGAYAGGKVNQFITDPAWASRVAQSKARRAEMQQEQYRKVMGLGYNQQPINPQLMPQGGWQGNPAFAGSVGGRQQQQAGGRFEGDIRQGASPAQFPEQAGLPQPQGRLGLPNLSAEGQGFKDPREGAIRMGHSGEASPIIEQGISPEAQQQANIKEAQSKMLNPTGDEARIQSEMKRIRRQRGAVGRETPEETKMIRQLAEARVSNLGFHSKAEQVILDKIPNNVDAVQLVNTLKNNGVKPDEISQLGLDILKPKYAGMRIDRGQNGFNVLDKNGEVLETFPSMKLAEDAVNRISKDDLLTMIKANQVPLEEKVLGDYSNEQKLAKAFKDKGYTIKRDPSGDVIYENPNGDEISHEELPRDLRDIATKISTSNESDIATKFSQYQLEGDKSNYREVLIKLPNNRKQSLQEFTANYRVKFPESTNVTDGQIKDIYERLSDTSISASGSGIKDDDVFRSSHFDDANILVHARINDRIVDGKKVLFIEEIQSDWHQKGRKEGYRVEGKPIPTELKNEYNEYLLYVRKNTLTDKERARHDELYKKFDEIGSFSKGYIPDAPFKKTWHELMFKRLLDKAVKEGYDSVAWTTGEQQASRYDLSKQISEVMYNTTHQALMAYDHNGDAVVVKNNIKPSDIEEYIGKEPAKKLLEQPYEEITTKGAEDQKIQRITGENLKVGGEGMKGFYDQMLPSFVNKYTKKWGGKVGIVDFNMGRPSGIKVGGSEGNYYPIDSESGVRIGDKSFEGVKEARDWGAEYSWNQNNNLKDRVHSLDITPAMRGEIKKSGQPLWSAIGATGLAVGASMQAEASQNDEELTKQFEGFKKGWYTINGRKTIGYGFELSNPVVKKLLPRDVVLGRRRLEKDEADKIFSEVYKQAEKDARSFVGNKTFNKLSPKRQAVVKDMAYNLGSSRLGKFEKFREALQRGDFNRASQEMKSSKWHSQVKDRAIKLEKMMRGK